VSQRIKVLAIDADARAQHRWSFACKVQRGQGNDQACGQAIEQVALHHIHIRYAVFFAGVGVNVVLGHGFLPGPHFFARNAVGFYRRILRNYPAGVFGFKCLFSLGGAWLALLLFKRLVVLDRQNNCVDLAGFFNKYRPR
jgi:hypothetical protein